MCVAAKCYWNACMSDFEWALSHLFPSVLQSSDLTVVIFSWNVRHIQKGMQCIRIWYVVEWIKFSSNFVFVRHSANHCQYSYTHVCMGVCHVPIDVFVFVIYWCQVLKFWNSEMVRISMHDFCWMSNTVRIYLNSIQRSFFSKKLKIVCTLCI